jgi:uncharacterized protein
VKFGLKESDVAYIEAVLADFSAVEHVVIFGSRAMGNHKATSDIDLCLKGKDISIDHLTKIHSRLNELAPFPYEVDVVHYENLNSMELKTHIDTYGIEFS